MIDQDKKKLRDGFYFSVSFLLIFWIIKLVEINFNLDFSRYGIFPRRISGLWGILFTPFLHKDLHHLFNNSVPFFVSIIGIFYFFRKSSLTILAGIWLITHILIWFVAGNGYHIGASGLVYGFMSFLFFGGAFSNNRNLLGLSLVIIFAYGTMFWGILPVETAVSWESHLMGAIVGMLFAFIFRKQGIPPEKFDWEEDEENVDDLTDEEIDELIDEKTKIKYRFIPGKKTE
ncbi:rhomboid family intramembrane serine protease [Bacteroidota bacterium]